jgi:hypothetical protein
MNTTVPTGGGFGASHFEDPLNSGRTTIAVAGCHVADPPRLEEGVNA